MGCVEGHDALALQQCLPAHGPTKSDHDSSRSYEGVRGGRCIGDKYTRMRRNLWPIVRASEVENLVRMLLDDTPCFMFDCEWCKHINQKPLIEQHARHGGGCCLRLHVKGEVDVSASHPELLYLLSVTIGEVNKLMTDRPIIESSLNQLQH